MRFFCDGIAMATISNMSKTNHNICIHLARAPIVYWGQISIKTLKVEVLLLAGSIEHLLEGGVLLEKIIPSWKCTFMVPAKNEKKLFFHVLKEICHQRFVDNWLGPYCLIEKKIVQISNIKNYKILSCLELILCWMKYGHL